MVVPFLPAVTKSERRFGRGRHGSKLGRSLLAAHMRERRASSALRAARGATAKSIADFLNSVRLRGRKRLTVRCVAKRGQKYGLIVKHTHTSVGGDKAMSAIICPQAIS